jgi:hypothetical protein
VSVSTPEPLASADRSFWDTFRSALTLSAVEVERESEMRTYLDSHPDMVFVTEQICKTARRIFGSEASLNLQVYCDPEIHDEYLILHVRLRSYPADMMERIRSVSDPFENELCDNSGSILVTTDFRPIG